jgi:hypothetical protein
MSMADAYRSAVAAPIIGARMSNRIEYNSEPP